MATIVYADEEPPFRGRPVPYSEQDAIKHWGYHYTNWRLLEFLRTTSPDPAEVRQARHEQTICQRKMDHWQRHANWTAREAARERARVDAMWAPPERRTT